MSFSRLFYVALSIVALWLAYHLVNQHKETRIQVAPNLELPIFSGAHLDNVSYDQNGLRRYVITSQHLDYYAKSGNTTFEYPMLKIYQQGTQLEWEITAKRGILTHDQVLILYDDVSMNNLLEESGFDRLTTAQLSIELNNRDFWTDSEVTLSGALFTTRGQAMKGNFSDHSALLYHSVQGYYETLTP